jgi:hypothetical protein
VKLPRLPKGIPSRAVTPFSRGPVVEMLWTDDVQKAAGIAEDDKRSLWQWCARHGAVYVDFAPGKSWEQLAGETLSEGYVRMVVDRPNQKVQGTE